MGFKRARTTYRMVWPEGHDNHGLEVVMTSMSTDELLLIGGMADLDLTSAGAEAMGALDEMIGVFASKLTRWNLEDEAGEPVPATFSGVKSQDLDFTMELIDAWMTHVAGVSAPLARNSDGGEKLSEESIPMEPLSESRAS